MRQALFAVCALLISSLLHAAERPNIIFVLTDDQGPWALGLSRHPDAKTPNLDRLFREGASLPNAFCVTPVCSPSRASIVTSRYGSEVGVTDWIQPRTEPDLGLDPSHLLWPEVLQQAGYRTGLIGKWHLGTRKEFHPTKNGYHHFMGFTGGGNKPKNPELDVNGEIKTLDGFLADLVTDDAIRFLQREKDKPFLLSLHFREPHAPWLPVAEADWQPFADLDPHVPNPDFPKLDIPRVKKATREYLASVHSVDRNMGRLLAELDRLHLTDNTIVIYSSDHGYNVGHHGVLHKGNGQWILTDPPPSRPNIPRPQRPNMFDTSLRVPTAIRWPGVIRPGTVIQHTVTHLDWYPTIVAMANVPLPRDRAIRGRNLVPLLKGEATTWDDDLYAEYSTHHTSKTHMRVYRTPEWKLMRDFLNPGRDELYHLTVDPDETTNLIDSTDPQVQRVRAELSARILAKMNEVGDPVARLAVEQRSTRRGK